MIVVRKFLGIVGWFFILFFGINIIGGAIVGGMAGADFGGDMEGAQRAGAEAGEAFALQYMEWILYGSAAIAVLGSIFGILPFTRHRRGRRD